MMYRVWNEEGVLGPIRNGLLAPLPAFAMDAFPTAPSENAIKDASKLHWHLPQTGNLKL